MYHCLADLHEAKALRVVPNRPLVKSLVHSGKALSRQPTDGKLFLPALPWVVKAVDGEHDPRFAEPLAVIGLPIEHGQG